MSEEWREGRGEREKRKEETEERGENDAISLSYLVTRIMDDEKRYTHFIYLHL